MNKQNNQKTNQQASCSECGYMYTPGHAQNDKCSGCELHEIFHSEAKDRAPDCPRCVTGNVLAKVEAIRILGWRAWRAMLRVFCAE